MLKKCYHFRNKHNPPRKNAWCTQARDTKNTQKFRSSASSTCWWPVKDPGRFLFEACRWTCKRRKSDWVM